MCCPVDTFDPRPLHKPAPPPSEAVTLEVEALRSMLGLPPRETESDEHALPEPTHPDTQIPPFTTPQTNPEGEQP